jgi:hypothetical protein
MSAKVMGISVCLAEARNIKLNIDIKFGQLRGTFGWHGRHAF